jgi:hypothetical protein
VADGTGPRRNGGPTRTSPSRCVSCGFPLISTASAPRSANVSRPNTQPAVSPVNASPPPSRASAHDSGPSWSATPPTCDSFIHFHPPVSRRAENSWPEFPFLRHFPSLQTVSRPWAVAVRRRFSGVLARGLAEARAERRPETALFGALLSEAGDLVDLAAGLKAAENLGLLLRKCGGVGETHGIQRVQPPNC